MAYEFHKAIRSVVLVTSSSDGASRDVQEIFSKGSGPRKRSRRLKGVEGFVRSLVKAHTTTANAYNDRHERSTRKKKDGWLRDLAYNASKASRKGRKEIKLRRLIPSSIR